MEDTRVFGSWQTATVIKRKRNSDRKPRKGSSLLFAGNDLSLLSYTSSSDDVKNFSLDDSSGFDASLQRKKICLNNPLLGVASLNDANDTTALKKSKKIEKFYVSNRSRDRGQHALDVQSEEYRTYSHRSAGPSSTGDESKFKKLKFKVGGVTQTLHATSNVKAANFASSSTKPSLSSNGSLACQKSTSQENWDVNHFSSGKERLSYGDEGEDACRANSSIRKFTEANLSAKIMDHTYLPRTAKDHRKGFISGDAEYVEEDEPVSDDGYRERKKKQKNLLADSPHDVRLEPLTKRQRSLQSSKDGNGSSLIEFPDGLPTAPSKRKKQKLSEVEQQAKKAEAAQRRKMQVEKAARESETAAIRKILGLDADKKKAEKEKAQAEKVKAANHQKLEGNTVRWTYGPNGTVVTFPENVDLPSILHSKPCSYPPPREKCAGPSCTNPYKYRDSKSNLPLCSLQCYKAVQGSACQVRSC